MHYKLENGALNAMIDTLGAEPVSLLFHGRERLWQNEDGSWAGHAPVLFPVCGNCAVTVGSDLYPLSRHGFARRMQFELKSQTESRLSLVLRFNEETLRKYPFEFVFTVTYSLEGDSLLISYEVENPAERPLSFSWGGHVSHALFAPLAKHILRFPGQERFEALLHDKEGRLTGEKKLYGAGRALPLSLAGPEGGNTLIFAPNSRAVTLCKGKKPLAKVEFEGFPYLLLWRPAGAAMLCIEPWGNLPDRAGEAIPFSQKTGIQTLAGGERASALQKITYFEV